MNQLSIQSTIREQAMNFIFWLMLMLMRIFIAWPMVND